jgi:hypothetical protein
MRAHGRAGLGRNRRLLPQQVQEAVKGARKRRFAFHCSGPARIPHATHWPGNIDAEAVGAGIWARGRPSLGES